MTKAANDGSYDRKLCALVDYRKTAEARLEEIYEEVGFMGVSREDMDALIAAKEAEYYRMSTVAPPEGVVLEVGGLETMPDGRLAVATRRGDVWLIENPASANGGQPHFSRFAQGLHEALGLA